MPRPTILVVDREESRRKELVRGLTSYGYEVIAGASGAEGQRFASGLNPGLVVVEAALVRPDDPFGLRAQTPISDSRAPTVVLFGAQDAEDLPEGVLAVTDADVTAAALLFRVRTALLARELGLTADPRLDSLVGDLQRLPLFDLLPMLQRAVATGRVEVGGGELTLDEGEVVAARAGEQGGVKAFARLARTAGGTFRIVLGPAAGEREIFKDLLSLMAIAIEDQYLYQESRTQLLALSSRLQLVMGPVFFATQFSPSQQRVLEAVQGSRTPWHVLDKVAAPDGEVLADLAHLHKLGIVKLEDPEVEVRVVTDSAADLPSELAERLRIQTVPLALIVGRQLYRDRVDLEPVELYRLLSSRAAHRHRPWVEPVAKDELVSVYRTVVGRSDIVSLHVSERLSQTVFNARAAAEQGREEFCAIRGDGTPAVEVVDSAQVSVGQTLLVVAAARMALRHLHAGEIRARVEAMRGRIHALFVADMLEFLAREGRLGKARSWLGGLLGVKPILGVADGNLALLDQVRTGKTAHPRVIELLAQRVDASRPVMVCVAHAAAPVWGARLRNLLQDAFKVSEVIEGEIGPAVGTLLGVGCVAVALFQPTEEELRLVAPLTDTW